MNKKDNKKNGAENSVKSKLTTWFERSTIHSFPNIVQANSIFLQVLWAIAFSACLAWCTFVTVKIALGYYSYATTISVSYMTETPTNFPAVTICNTNALTQARSLEFQSLIIKSEIGKCVGFDATTFVNAINWGPLATKIMRCTNSTSALHAFDLFMLELKRIISNSNYTDDYLLEVGFSFDLRIFGKRALANRYTSSPYYYFI
jgi:hypothetical protein